MREKVGFTGCVFERLCFSGNTIFQLFQQSTAVAIQKLHAEKYEKLWVGIGHAKKVFLFFQASMLWFVFFVCLVKLEECSKMLVFSPVFWVLWGGFFFFFIWELTHVGCSSCHDFPRGTGTAAQGHCRETLGQPVESCRASRIGFGKGVFWKGVFSFRKVHFLEILENLVVL